MNRLAITYLDPASLKPNPWNPNEVDPVNQDKIKNSIQREGFIKNVMVRELDNGDLEIIGGHHRVLAAIELGITEIPVINHGAVSDGQAKRWGQIDNARYGQDNLELLAELFADGEIGDAQSLMDILPYDEDDFVNIFEHTGLDDVDLDIDIDDDDDIDLSGIGNASPTKTHQILRFKVAIDDADHIGELIARTKQEQGFTDSDDLTNAGDALTHLIRKLDTSYE